jgi:hypothetical protein
VYGPVRTVVWEGRSGDAPLYPDSLKSTRLRDELDPTQHIHAIFGIFNRILRNGNNGILLKIGRDTLREGASLTPSGALHRLKPVATTLPSRSVLSFRKE